MKNLLLLLSSMMIFASGSAVADSSEGQDWPFKCTPMLENGSVQEFSINPSSEAKSGYVLSFLTAKGKTREIEVFLRDYDNDDYLVFSGSRVAPLFLFERHFKTYIPTYLNESGNAFFAYETTISGIRPDMDEKLEEASCARGTD